MTPSCPTRRSAELVEQQLPSRACERQISKLVEHDQVEPRQLRRQGPALADPGLLFEACPHIAPRKELVVAGEKLPCPRLVGHHGTSDRKSVVSGRSVSVRVALGGRRHIIKKYTYCFVC